MIDTNLRARKRLYLVLAATLLMLAFATSVALAESREFQASPGGALEISLSTGGSISVTGWSSNSVEVQWSTQGRDRDDLEVSFDQQGDRIRIQSRLRTKKKNTNASANLVVRAPHRFDIELETMGGAVTLSDLDGAFSGRTMGGELRLADLTGSVDLTTMGGEVQVLRSEVDGKVTTMGGNVTIREVTGNLEGKSMGGNVIYDNVSRGSGADEVVRISTMGGKVEVKEAMSGAELETMGGSIRVTRAAEFVKAKTMGGNIRVEEIDGWLDLVTMGGNVDAVMVGTSGKRDVSIESKGGDIRLVIPDGLGLEIDIKLEFTRGHEGKHQIRSDFPIQTETSSNWQGSGNSARRVIKGTGRHGGGGAKIEIRTVNGDVHLVRGN